MSMIREIENAWHSMISTVAAKASTVTSGTADGGSTTTLVDAAISGTDWQWAVVVMTSGSNSGSWRVVTAWNDTTDTCTFRSSFRYAVAAGDTYTITFAPLGGANVFLRRPHPDSLRKADLPAVLVSAMRTRAQSVEGINNARRGVLTVTTDVIAPYDDTDAAEVVSDKLFEQIDQMRTATVKLASNVAHFQTPTGEDQVSNFGEIGDGQAFMRVYWSVLRTPFHYNL